MGVFHEGFSLRASSSVPKVEVEGENSQRLTVGDKYRGGGEQMKGTMANPRRPACLILMESNASPLGDRLETISKGVIVRFGRVRRLDDPNDSALKPFHGKVASPSGSSWGEGASVPPLNRRLPYALLEGSSESLPRVERRAERAATCYTPRLDSRQAIPSRRLEGFTRAFNLPSVKRVTELVGKVGR